MIDETTVRKSDTCESAKIALPEDATGVRAEPDLADADWLAGHYVDVSIFVQPVVGPSQFWRWTLQTGPKGNGDMPALGLHDDTLLRGATVWATAETHKGGMPIGIRLVAVSEKESLPDMLTKPVAAAIEDPVVAEGLK